MPGGPLGIGGDNRLGDVIREGVRGDGDHGGVDVFEECWTLIVIQYRLQPAMGWMGNALLHCDMDEADEGEGGWGGIAVGAVCGERLEWAEASLDDS